jgi:Family of unknown function (DUF6788)
LSDRKGQQAGDHFNRGRLAGSVRSQVARCFARPLGDLQLGGLSTQYNVFGTPGCRCKATPPEKHGPYCQVSFTRKGKSRSKFVRKEDIPAVRRELKNNETMKKLVDRRIDMAIERSNLRMARNRA